MKFNLLSPRRGLSDDVAAEKRVLSRNTLFIFFNFGGIRLKTQKFVDFLKIVTYGYPIGTGKLKN